MAEIGIEPPLGIFLLGTSLVLALLLKSALKRTGTPSLK